MNRMKLAPGQPAPEGESFERFDKLFRAVISVPKAAVEEQEAKESEESEEAGAPESRPQEALTTLSKFCCNRLGKALIFRLWASPLRSGSHTKHTNTEPPQGSLPR
jgi:hypothetical protein